MAGNTIDELFAFVVLDDEDGNEGIPAVQMGEVWWPMIGADMAHIESFRPMAEATAKLRGCNVELRVWSGPYRLVEVIQP